MIRYRISRAKGAFRAPGRALNRGSARSFGGFACLWVLCSCAARPAVVNAPAAAPSARAAAVFSDDTAPLARYRSKRLGLSLPLPDGRSWRIDDHTRPELVATHSLTRSKIVVAVLRATDNVGRTQCEDMARAEHLVPEVPIVTVADEVLVTQGSYDTRVRVVIAPGGGPNDPVAGHVMAFGGYLRKCYVFDFSTEVGSAADEAALSSRLAFVRTRVLGGLQLDAFVGAGGSAAMPRAPERRDAAP